jgi:predicted enzyme related to lactoylglutathione lyase
MPTLNCCPNLIRVRLPPLRLRFYNGLFGWCSQKTQAPGMTYRVLSAKDGDQQ